MKRIFFALTMLSLFFSAAPQLRAADVSFELFYNNLNDGNWVEVGDYGYCWQPNAASDASWRPYADGYWTYTDVGWTWVSNEDFGWATYHYGRWARLADLGWVWIPGTEWGPAWVSWRTGGDQIGWAPLPPARTGEVVYEGRPITGQVDIEFDIGPMYYNFVDVRYIGEPRLRDRIYEPSRNVTFISNTVNVTNITYTNSTVYNYGPDYSQISQRAARPIQRLTLQRQTNVASFQPRGATKVEGGRLVVAAPISVQKAPPTVAPKAVKRKIPQPKVETGWSGIKDPNVKTQLQQKMKSEPASAGAQPGAQPAQGNSPAVGVSPADAASPGIAASPGVTASPAASAAATRSTSPAATRTESPAAKPTASPATTPAGSPLEKGRGRGTRGQPGATPLGTPERSPAMSPSGRAGKRDERTSPAPTDSSPAQGATTEDAASQRRGKAGRTTSSPAKQPNANAPERTPMPKQEKGRNSRESTTPAPDNQPKAEAQGRSNAERQGASAGEPATAEQGRERGATRKTVTPNGGNAADEPGRTRGGGAAAQQPGAGSSGPQERGQGKQSAPKKQKGAQTEASPTPGQ